MRYDRGHRDRTRQHIVDSASKQFRAGGLSATGIATVMSEAGLTNGAFYPHFSSKDDLIEKTLAAALEEQNDRQKQFLEAEESFETVVRSYLRWAHRECSGTGCPSAALLPEIARQSVVTRRTYQIGLSAIIKTLAQHFPNESEELAKRKAMSIFALLVGTLQIARAVPDRQFAESILQQGAEAALCLAKTPTGPSKKPPERNPFRHELDGLRAVPF